MTPPQYEVLIVKYGTRTALSSEVFLNYPIYQLPDAPIGMDYFLWVVRNPERTVVLDTGYSPAGGLARNRTTLVTPPDALAALGVSFGADTTVVLSHAHYDHAGNLTAFPASQIVMSAAERNFWSSAMAKRHQFQHSAEEADLAELDRAAGEGRLTTFTGELELAPGIRLIEVGGHTAGQLIMQVSTNQGTALLASDAVHYYQELESDLPFTVVTDLPGMYSGFDRITQLIASGEVEHVVSGHDPSTLGRFETYDHPSLPGLVSIIGRQAAA